MGVGESGPREGLKLVDPFLLEGLALGDQISYVDRKVGKMESFGGLCRCGLAAFANEKLAESPARETGFGVEMGDAALGNGGEERLQELRRLGAGTGEDGVDEAEDRRESVGLAQLEEPAAGHPANGASLQGMEEVLVLLDGAVDGEQAFEGGGIEMLVLHAFFSF
jgi:hypothetical protein